MGFLTDVVLTPQLSTGPLGVDARGVAMNSKESSDGVPETVVDIAVR